MRDDFKQYLRNNHVIPLTQRLWKRASDGEISVQEYVEQLLQLFREDLTNDEWLRRIAKIKGNAKKLNGDIESIKESLDQIAVFVRTTGHFGEF